MAMLLYVLHSLESTSVFAMILSSFFRSNTMKLLPVMANPRSPTLTILDEYELSTPLQMYLAEDASNVPSLLTGTFTNTGLVPSPMGPNMLSQWVDT